MMTFRDYAAHLSYTAQFGRFMSADRYQQAAQANSSGSWNKYSFALGDPVNRIDPSGRFDCDPDDPEDCDPGPCADFDSTSCPDPGPASGPATAPDPGIIQDCNQVLTEDITVYLAGYANGKTPLNTTGNISAMVMVGLEDNVDPRLVVALAVAETSAGQHMGWGKYHAWNNGHQSYSGWFAAVSGVTANLENNYIQKGLTNTTSLYDKYEAPTAQTQKVHDRQLGVLNAALNAMHGNTGELTDPCNAANSRPPNQ